MEAKSKYKFVNYLWDEKKAKLLGDDQVSLFLYRSNILGEDLRITNYGGGNTVFKSMRISYHFNSNVFSTLRSRPS